MIVVGDCLQLRDGAHDLNPWTFVVVGFEQHRGMSRVQLVRLDGDLGPRRRRIEPHPLAWIEGDLRDHPLPPDVCAWSKL